jgi:diamine N-acetyltransferase
MAIRGNRVTLRLMTHDDVDTFVAYRSDPETLELLESRRPPPVDAVHRDVDEMAAHGCASDGHWVHFAVTLTGSDEMIGDVGVGLSAGGAIADIGYVMRPEYRGKGLTAEAAGLLVDHVIEHHGTHRITAELSPLNVASMRVLESIGMSFESRTKLSCCVDGEWEDDLRYAMLADERRAWIARDRSPVNTVELVEVDADNVHTWGALRTHHSQEQYVAPMAMTFRDALFPETVDGVVSVPWMRGLAADGVPAGFMMCSTTNGRQHGWYLWRLLIDRSHQRRGVGTLALTALIEQLRALDVPALFTSYVEGPGGPRRFYEGLGFRPTGGIVDGEIELVLALS